MEGRRAEPCVAQRADRAPGKDWLAKVAAVHSITSYPVGRTSEPTFRMHAAKQANEDETHLRNGIWLAPGWHGHHPSCAERGERRGAGFACWCYAFKVAPAGTSPVVR